MSIQSSNANVTQRFSRGPTPNNYFSFFKAFRKVLQLKLSFFRFPPNSQAYLNGDKTIFMTKRNRLFSVNIQINFTDSNL